MMSPRDKGFTFIELLVVLGVLAILFATGYNTYRKARFRAEVRSGLATLATTLREARSSSQRFNVTARVQFATPRRFTLLAKNRLGQVHRNYSRELSPVLEIQYSKDGVHWQSADALSSVTYKAPFGETNASSTLLRVQHTGEPGIAACLRIIGVTGRVVVARACP